jgi:AcrR family transcriptional regulator
MGRPREHDERTGQTLLDVAERLLADGGDAAVTVRAVADAANTTTRAVYAVFGAKEGLTGALAGRGYRLLAEWVRGLDRTQDPAADLVETGVRGFRRFAITRPHLFRITFEQVSAQILAMPTIGPDATSSYRALEERIQRAQDANVLGGTPNAEVAFAFHSLCVGLANGELSRLPPPQGAGFWRPVHGVDGEHLWRTALTALVSGFNRTHG